MSIPNSVQRSTSRAAWLVAISLLAAGAAAPARADDVAVLVTGLRNASGQVLVALHASADSYPGRWDRAVAVERRPASGAGAPFLLRDVPPGRYAIVVVHDEDGDGEMSKNFLGLPKEGFGASNNPAFLGPPRFESASFVLAGPRTVPVRVVYFQ